MNSTIPKRLIEVDLPIKRISEHARREKSIRHGHISTLHIWWARRPLAACRAVLCASLWPDPADPLCPESFRLAARQCVTKWANENLKLLGTESYERFIELRNDPARLHDDKELRYALLDFIADFANWDNSTVEEFLETSRALTKAAHDALSSSRETNTLVVDPFAGGGSIPLEALRVGADAFASDLNPIPVLLNKVVLEYIPKYGERLADQFQRTSAAIRAEAEKELATFYEVDVAEPKTAFFLWFKTVLSEAPDTGKVPIEIPLLRSLWLSKAKGRNLALRWVRDSSGKVATHIKEVTYADGNKLRIRQPALEIFRPKSAAEVESGTSKGGAAICPVTGYTTPVESVRKQLSNRKGGASDARLGCVIGVSKNSDGRNYRLGTREDELLFWNASAKLDELKRTFQGRLSLLPNGEINHLRGFFNVVLYGMHQWCDLFSPRQSLALVTFARLIREKCEELHRHHDPDFAAAVQTCLSMALGRMVDYESSLCMWAPAGEFVCHTFGRQALPMVWDFAEVNPLSDTGWGGACEWVQRVIAGISASMLKPGNAIQASALHQPLPTDSADVTFTDPPYYAAIPYADLSDFFYGWLQRSLGNVHKELFEKELAPKEAECVALSHRAAMYRHKDSKWFEDRMTEACRESRRVTKNSGVGVFVFANKETAGWEAMLGALIAAGWSVTASWPIDTERGGRLRARNSAALASSVHLVCRPRAKSDESSTVNSVGDWRDVLQELPRRIHEWMPRLAEEGVVGADAIFACLGPALEIFSRYSSVEKASGQIVPLREYLEQVWAAVAKEALTMVFKGADASGFEEDARLTAMWLWTLFAGQSIANGLDDEADEEDESEESASQQKGYVLEYDAARKIAQGLGANLETLTSLVEIKGETVVLLSVAERTRKLFGSNESESPTKVRKKKKAQLQLGFVAELEQAEETGSWGSKGAPSIGATVLDRVHQSMILFAAGRSEALRRFLVDEGVGRDERFWRLAQVLSFLYPKTSDEKRWIDGVLGRKKGLGF